MFYPINSDSDSNPKKKNTKCNVKCKKKMNEKKEDGKENARYVKNKNLKKLENIFQK